MIQLGNFKTNAMRILDKEKIPYNTYTYDHSDGLIDGISVANKLGQPLDKVFKTLVTIGAARQYYVFVIPVSDELDIKAAARAVGEKSIEMIKVSDINKVTGYIRGGCSPIGMKKDYATVIHSSCKNIDKVIISAGKLGHQIEISPADLIKLINAKVENIKEK